MSILAGAFSIMFAFRSPWQGWVLLVHQIGPLARPRHSCDVEISRYLRSDQDHGCSRRFGRVCSQWSRVAQVLQNSQIAFGGEDGRIALLQFIKRLAAQAGMEAKDLAGHSLRAGLATAAAAAGVSERAIMAQTGHRSLATLRKYIREGSLFLENAAAKVGL